MHVFTSITANYLPKARVLATSVKRFHPEAVFHLLFADSLSGIPPADLRVFDHILTPEELPIPQLRAWIFKHNLVELCTAIKGVGACEILRAHGAERLYYFDPDIAVLSRLDGLESYLDKHPFILTPHLCVHEEDPVAVVENEICSLRHGVFNLGFLGVRACNEGRRFLDWWTQRLLDHCYDDAARGLFTDQRWADFAPIFFPGLRIVRDPEYNVATWNLTHRKATGSAPYGILVEHRPLCFFHFSGLDCGAQEYMLRLFGESSPVLFDLRRWYLSECERMGQSRYEKRKCMYGFYNDGTPVTKEQRILYRNRADLQDKFPDPYATEVLSRSYLHWYEGNVAAPARALVTEKAAWDAQRSAQEAQLAAQGAQITAQEAEVRRLHALVAQLQAELSGIRASRSWRLARLMSLSRSRLIRWRLLPARA